MKATGIAAASAHGAAVFAGGRWLLAGVLAWPLAAPAQDGAALAARHHQLRAALAANAYQRPLYLESTEIDGDLKGDVYAQLAQPFTVVAPALREIGAWCDILILQPNVKRCRASGTTLVLDLGRKFDQPASDAYRVEFDYGLLADSAGYLQVALHAEHGPLGTRRYRIALEAAPLGGGGTFVHLSYAYATGIASRLAAQVYLSTIGRDKVGFTVVGAGADGQPLQVGGTRGVIERNAMRCYLAIDAYLDALAAPAPARLERRLALWYDSAERYPRQLHELEREPYLEMKRAEVRR